MIRQTTAAVLSSLLLVGPVSPAWAAPALGTISGQLTVDGRPLSGMGLALVDLNSGEIYRTKSDARGNYRVRVLPGAYVVTSSSLAGLGVGKAPTRVVVESGRVVVASLELMKLPVVYQAPEPQQTPSPATGPQTSGNITHEPIGCLVAGQFPLLDATIEPAASVARARTYFKSALGEAYYFVEGALVEAKFTFKLPKPKLEASPITYYIQATTTEFGESQTAEVQAQVVADESECPEGLKVAPIGPPGAVTVFSATTAAVAVPVGFAATGVAVAGGTIASVALGGAALTLGARELGPDTAAPATTTTTTIPPPLPACRFDGVFTIFPTAPPPPVLQPCVVDPLTEQTTNCPCNILPPSCATRILGAACPENQKGISDLECCTFGASCPPAPAPTAPPPSGLVPVEPPLNQPCDRSLPSVIIPPSK